MPGNFIMKKRPKVDINMVISVESYPFHQLRSHHLPATIDGSNFQPVDGSNFPAALHLKLKKYPRQILDMFYITYPKCFFSGDFWCREKMYVHESTKISNLPFSAVLHPSQTLAVSSYSSCNCSVELQVNSPWVMYGCSACLGVANATPTSQWEIKKRFQ